MSVGFEKSMQQLFDFRDNKEHYRIFTERPKNLANSSLIISIYKANAVATVPHSQFLTASHLSDEFEGFQ